MNRGEPNLHEQLTAPVHEIVAVDGFELNETASGNEDGTLRKFLEVAKDGHKHIPGKNRDLVKKMTSNRLRCEGGLYFACSETKRRMDRVDEDVLGIRQLIDIRVHQCAGRSKKENAAAAIHDELDGVHENL